MASHEDTQEFAAVHTNNAPKAIGPYSQAISTTPGRMVFTSGQIAILPSTGKLLRADIEEQTRQVMTNLREVLQAAGGDLANLVKVTIFLKNLEDFSMVNAVYSSYLSSPYPARATIEVSRLPMDALVEIEGVAVI
ncbi:MAG TPA: reactive intermediate/imine deaminase [Myxococcales bacterium]|nr:reactive intermediate/imine deaminase [Myxococcales bacterium]HAN31620.1 reactive intermediate/imine deaminase [Myxococcales bacterium]